MPIMQTAVHASCRHWDANWMQTVPKLAACINAARQANQALGGLRGKPSKLRGGCAEAANTEHVHTRAITLPILNKEM